MSGRAENRPIPKTLAAWRKELNGIERFIANAQKLALSHGDGWVTSMLSYYKERRKVLQDNPPPKSKKARK